MTIQGHRKMRGALEVRLAAITPELPTAWQNWGDESNPIPPEAGTAYQEVWLMPARNRGNNLKNSSTLHRGILQVNLCYPAGDGTDAAEQRAELIQAAFDASGPMLENDGIKVRIMRQPDIGGQMDHRPGYIVIPVSISYEAIF